LDDSEHNNKSDKSDQNVVTRGVHQVLNALFETSPGSHNILVYSDIRVLRDIYPVYIKYLLNNNEIILILTYYDHPSFMKEILTENHKKSDANNIEGYVRDGSLVIVDSLMSYFNNNHKYAADAENNLNFLSLIRILLNHGIRNNKNGITIFSDMGSFFHIGLQYDHDIRNNDVIIQRILEFERSIPSRYKNLELKKFCMYHQKDYESHFVTTRQKAQLLDCHGRSILVMDNNNDY
jgi:hypothetical protein